MKGCLTMIGGLVVVVVAIGIIAAIVGSNAHIPSNSGSVSSTSSVTTPDHAPAPVVKAPTAFDMSPDDATGIYQYYQNNEIKADNDMKDKWVLVTGRVGKIGKDILNTPYVFFNGDSTGIFGVQCMFSNADEISKVSNLNAGDTISIAGVCQGKMGNIIFRQCQIVGADAKKVGDKVHVVLIDQ